jgi:hypothetical protein
MADLICGEFKNYTYWGYVVGAVLASVIGYWVGHRDRKKEQSE